jgi:hypothetical protein
MIWRGVFISFLQVAVTAIAARRLGRFAGISQKWESPQLSLVFETAIGLAFISYFIFIAACFHWISPFFLIMTCLALIPFALWELRGIPKRLPSLNIWCAAASLYTAWIFLGSLLPPSDRDELIYQLEIPRQILKTGGMKFFSDNPYAYFPQFGSMLAILGLGTAGEIAAKLYHALFGMLTAFSIYAAGRKYLTQNLAATAAAIFFTTPVVMVLMTLAYVDLTYTFYAFLAMLILLNDQETILRRAFAAGVMSGCAAAVKYPGLQYAGLLGVLCLVQYLKDRDKKWLAAIPALSATTLFFVAPYLIRNFIVTGWPVFPFAVANFSLRPEMHWSAEQADLYLSWLGQYGTPLGQAAFLHTLAAPVLVFITGRFNEPRFYDGILGPVFLLIPLILIRLKLSETLKKMGLFSLLFLYYWAMTTKQIRFLVPVLPVLCLLLAYGLQSRKNPAWKILCVVLVLWNVTSGAREILTRDPLPFWKGKETREDYLRRQLPGYTIYQETNRRLAPGDKVFLIQMKNYGYYLNVPWAADFIFERYRLDKCLEGSSVQDLKNFFSELKITHLLMDESHLQSSEWGLEPEKLDVLRQFLKAHAQLDFRDRQFALYEIPSS